MADEQARLTGAYYGPSIPPPSKAYRRRGLGGRFCCNQFSCLFNRVFQILTAILIVLGTTVLVLWLIYRPNKIKFQASDAALKQFDLQNNTLHFNLAVNFTIRNPNKRIGIYYDRIEATASYEKQILKTSMLQPFYQGRENTSYLGAEFRGEQLVGLGSVDLSEHTEYRVAAMYEIKVRLNLRIRTKFGAVKSPRRKPTVDCDLMIPLNSYSTANRGFFRTKDCDFDWR